MYFPMRKFVFSSIFSQIPKNHPERVKNYFCPRVFVIHSKLKYINQSQPIGICHYINHLHNQQYHTYSLTKPKTKPSNEQPQKTTRKPYKPIPFITSLKEIQDPDEALSLFQEYHQMGFKHDYPSYSALIYKLARSRDFDAVETVLGYIQDRNICCRETLFIALIQHYGKAHLVDKAIELFHRMTSFDCVRTIQTLNTLINVLVDNGRFLDAKGTFEGSYKMGFHPNSVSFNIIIKGLLDKGDWEEACKMFDEMLDKKLQPSVVTYNSLIGFLCRNGDLDKAKDLLEDMFQKGKYPNAITYALLMEGLCSTGEYKEAKKMMFDMEYRGCKPRLVNFGVLMSDLGKRGKIEEAKSLLGEMKKRRFKPDVVTYNILVNYLCKEGKTEEAYKVLIEMQIKGCEPNAATYRMMVDGFCRVGDFEDGLKVLSAMLISKHCPRLETFGCLVMGLLRSGKTDGACFVLEEMEKRSMGFDLGAWETLVRNSCGSNGGAGVELVTELISSTR